MSEQKEKQPVKEQLQAELDKWQTKMDEAKLQLHLGAKDAQDRLQPHIDQLELEMDKAKQRLKELESSSDSAWDEIKGGFSLSLKAMERAFDRAQQHFTKKDEN